MLALAKGGMDGTTSAHAENTTPPRGSCENPRNYLRARGEYGANHFASGDSQELPPRTRRILSAASIVRMMRGTTSAHAENTSPGLWRIGTARNYLRARGEYDPADHPALTEMELPPRTRRILPCATMAAVATGTTSAHAENTTAGGRSSVTAGNYLRARGEYTSATLAPASFLELPPRTRRIQHPLHDSEG